MQQAFVGIDVGTSSARAGIFDENGSLLATARHPITVWHEAGSVVEQSSSEIWAACAASVRGAMAEAALPASAIKGIGFDATCSLVVVDVAGNPLTVSVSGDERRNVIVWMDHRAITEARRVNETRDDVLRYVGGSVSPEMEIPKLLCLKRHLPSTYHSAGHFFDLADYLSFRATGSTAHSMCTLACKWNYLAHERRWSGSYLERIGHGDGGSLRRERGCRAARLRNAWRAWPARNPANVDRGRQRVFSWQRRHDDEPYHRSRADRATPPSFAAGWSRRRSARRLKSPGATTKASQRLATRFERTELKAAFQTIILGIERAGRSILSAGPAATADATDTWPRHPGIAADPCRHDVLERARVHRLRAIFRCRV